MKMLEVVQKFESGEYALHEIVVAPHSFFCCLRVTGFGRVPRNLNESVKNVERVKALYLSEAFMFHCSRLPITIGHPVNGTVDKDSLKTAPIVGQTLKAFYEGGSDEVWAVCEIYVKDILKFFEEKEKRFSTSPGFFIHIVGVDGDEVKEEPNFLNHLALVDVGRWDKTLDGKESKGVKDGADTSK